MATPQARARYVWARAMTVLRALVIAGSIAYAGGIVSWLVLQTLFGDTRWWWLALANTFALYLFVPRTGLRRLVGRGI
jgi:hypothetical protein